MAESNSSKNVVVFGQTGSGKSSIVNMLAGSTLAKVSGGAGGCTPSSKAYIISLGNENRYTIWDTAGLNESEDGTVSPHEAVKNLLTLVKDHGVNLLIYCIRAERLTKIASVNYDLFFGTICRREVPIVLVVTGLEGKDDMDDWWHENQRTIKKMDMSFDGYACITSWKGRNNMYEKEYEESVEKVWKLVRRHCRRESWCMPATWPEQAEKEIDAYEKKYYNARSGTGIRKFLQELVRFFLFGR